MRVAVASFEFEGNTLSRLLHRREDFARKVLAEGGDVLPAVRGRDLAVTGGIDALSAAAFEAVPILVAHGGSGGRVEGAFHRDVRERILAGIAGGSFAGIFLALHGAMICEGEDDPEGDLLERVRGIVGPGVPIAASLDLHAHVTPRMAASADILVGYETYPHVDAYGTGARAAGLLVRAMRGEIRPVCGLRRLDALLPVTGGATQGDAPMAEVRRLARGLERDGRALSVSYFPVQPWLDVADVGIAGVAVTDGDGDAADAAAGEVVQAMWDRRRRFAIPTHAPDEAVRRAVAHPAGRVLISDAPDCVGGGAPGDAPAVLAALLRHAATVPSAVCVVDPAAAAAARAAGVGARVSLPVGSTLDPRWHAPVLCEGTVESLSEGSFTYAGGISAGTPGNMGPTAVVRVGEVRVVIATYATYEYGDEQYRAAGLDPGGLRILAFKNPMNFRTLLDARTDWLMVGGPGPTTPSLEGVDWRVKARPFWPCDDLPEPRRLEA